MIRILVDTSMEFRQIEELMNRSVADHIEFQLSYRDPNLAPEGGAIGIGRTSTAVSPERRPFRFRRR